MSRGSASAQTMEAEPPDIRYQALPGNEYNHLGLLYIAAFLQIYRVYLGLVKDFCTDSNHSLTVLFSDLGS